VTEHVNNQLWPVAGGKKKGKLLNQERLNVCFVSVSASASTLSARLHLYAGADFEEFYFYNISQVIQMQHI